MFNCVSTILNKQMMDKDKPISILIPDGESHLLIHVINCLSEIKGIKIHLMSDERRMAMRYSRYVHNFSFYPKTKNSVDWINNINKELDKFPIDIILPIFEIGIRKLIAHRDLLKSPEKLVALPNLTDFDSAIDKWNLSQHMKKTDIPCPETKLVSFENDSQPIDYPVIVKPIKGFGGGMGVRLILNNKDWSHFLEQNASSEVKYILQEYIQGGDYCCNVLCLNGEIKYYTIQKGIRWGTNRFTAQTGYTFIKQKDILSIVTKLMNSLNWSGVACIDIKFDEQKKIFKIIEINTRYWSSLMGSFAAGINFPLLSIGIHLNKYEGERDFKTIEYLNLKGMLSYLKEDLSRIFHFSYIWNNSPLKYALKDPIPMIYKFISRSKNILLKRLHK